MAFQKELAAETVRADRARKWRRRLHQSCRHVALCVIGEILLACRKEGACRAPVQGALVAVFDGKVHLYGHFGIEHFFAQRTPVQVVGVNVEQVFLKLVWFGERFAARLANVLARCDEQVRRQVALEAIPFAGTEFAMRTVVQIGD